MKHISLIALLSFSLTAFAHDHGDGKNFNEVKDKVLKGIDQRMAHLQEHKACVSAATKKEDLKACHMKMKEKREAFRREKKK